LSVVAFAALGPRAQQKVGVGVVALVRLEDAPAEDALEPCHVEFNQPRHHTRHSHVLSVSLWFTAWADSRAVVRRHPRGDFGTWRGGRHRQNKSQTFSNGWEEEHALARLGVVWEG